MHAEVWEPAIYVIIEDQMSTIIWKHPKKRRYIIIIERINYVPWKHLVILLDPDKNEH